MDIMYIYRVVGENIKGVVLTMVIICFCAGFMPENMIQLFYLIMGLLAGAYTVFQLHLAIPFVVLFLSLAIVSTMAGVGLIMGFSAIGLAANLVIISTIGCIAGFILTQLASVVTLWLLEEVLEC